MLSRGRGAVLVLLGLVTGCPEESEPELACSGQGDADFAVSPRGGEPLSNGAEVPVFPPPQGGVFTELDVSFAGMTAEDLDSVRITIDDQTTGDSLSLQQYSGVALVNTLACQQDDTLLVRNLPVGFVDSVVLADLEGVGARLTMTVTTLDEGEIEQSFDVVLKVTGA